MGLSPEERDEFMRRLEKKGLRQVRIEWANGEYQNKGNWLPLVLEWVRIREFEQTFKIANRSFYISVFALLISILAFLFRQ